MQNGNILFMPSPHSSNQDPDGLTAVWKSVHKIEKEIKEIKTNLPKPSFSFWRWFWTERNWSIGAMLVLLGAVATCIWYIGGLILDNHLGSALGPTNRDIATINGQIGDIKNEIAIMRAQFAATKYSAVPPQEMKQHRTELTEIKDNLAAVKRDTPGFWPASFQVINLLSRATSPVQPKYPLLDLSDIHGAGGEIFKYPPGSVLKLHKIIENVILRDAIVYLDSNVVLHNVTFIDCTLVLPEVQQSPPRPLQQIGDQLLTTSDLSHITLTAG
jgi:hypothetical protein